MSYPNEWLGLQGSDLKNVRELVAWAKSHPGKLNYASVGNGSSSHLDMEMLKSEIGIAHV